MPEWKQRLAATPSHNPGLYIIATAIVVLRIRTMVPIPSAIELLHGPGPILLESLEEARIDALAEGVEPIGADAECAFNERLLLVEDLDQVGDCAGIEPSPIAVNV
jgi:hypothetical protein